MADGFVGDIGVQEPFTIPYLNTAGQLAKAATTSAGDVAYSSQSFNKYPAGAPMISPVFNLAYLVAVHALLADFGCRIVMPQVYSISLWGSQTILKTL